MVTDMPLKSLITSAYGVREVAIFGLPAWAEQARYDIRAKLAETDPGPSQRNLRWEERQVSMAAMLEDRFHLKLHAVQKELPVYDLILLKSGPKFNRTAGNGVEPRFEVRRTEVHATARSISSLAFLLEELVERTVIDKTGLTGEFDFHLQWAADDLVRPPDGAGLPSIFTALEEQMGLKLRPGKGPVKTLVVDHVERPSEN